ncbi:erythritol/L-threitol dehydrogenase [Rhodococcus sp. 06-156-3C]|uniref:erythritol/L-threitol dehyrogenase n=1 Tax=Nocardiaceae TaxID=85025 RepID=UPI000522FB40|nr:MULTISPECIES: erythritol/L-threitol dehyrogenase [Rhodococcus]OZD13420.1 erythritol/L-threitol dehydrogenase [Rhodococcus sp. 06-156-3C]OZD14065.1 erythritol/L-threitol dehydrogenase [Rhodococcus sp. 06-156-4C]OZD28767.1 erythritol/L-threitol dehydrogenase [Rhodococcus sp. 06-156-3]OZD28868.1 erythritol/L-threitol dehydrogenase [Rhodococcus sp. 06-156-4a]OZD34954.1 erythritol/L-threitol dehydrogenase [Rhodococcus sp. 06-156-3b]
MPDTTIPEKMQAVVCHGPEDYRLEEVPVPVPGPGEALVRVEAVGICASDLKCYHGAAKFWGDENRPAWAETDVIPGHEFVGEIVVIDDEASARWNVSVGDRVVSEQIVPCWKCRFCLRGQYHMCAPHDLYGFKRRTPGAMASYMVYPAEALVHKVSKDIPAAHAAFTEPLSCSLHAVERVGITFDDVVVVAGCGPIGLGMIAGARAKNPAHVIALDMQPEKLALAKECGADIVVDIRNEDAEKIVKDLTDGYGADVYLEGTGHPTAVPQGLNLLRKLGTYVEYGVFGSDVTVDWSIISDDKELDVLGAHLGPYCWPAAIRMIESGVLPMDKICTHQLPLADFQKGLDLVGSGAESVKVSLIPS